MSKTKKYDFGEQVEEWSSKQKAKIPVWISPKFEQSRQAAIKLIEKYDFLNEGDFWILKNETRNGNMGYTGLIISHNACLKLNDRQETKNKFKPENVITRISDYNNALLYEYCNAEQGIYEVGEVTHDNCKNDYPHAMAYKRCFDRVVLKLTKIAFDGIYSESEADDFKEPVEPKKAEEQGGYTCELCGASVYGTKDFPAEDMKKLSIKKYGQPLCIRCAQKAKAQMEKAATETATVANKK